jgi:hypothetical protein
MPSLVTYLPLLIVTKPREPSSLLVFPHSPTARSFQLSTNCDYNRTSRFAIPEITNMDRHPAVLSYKFSPLYMQSNIMTWPPKFDLTPEQQASNLEYFRHQLLETCPATKRDDVDLSGKTAILTGANGGIGVEWSGMRPSAP